MRTVSKVKIKELFDIEKGTLQSSKNIVGEYDFITASTVWKTHNEYTHECEALIYAVGASGSLGRTHYVNGKFITSDLCFILTPKEEMADKLNLKFYYHYFNFNRPEIVSKIATGTSKKAINITNFSNFEIDFVENQESLLSLIERSLPKQQNLIEILNQNASILSEAKLKVLEEAFMGRLTGIGEVENVEGYLDDVKKEKQEWDKEKNIKKKKGEVKKIQDDETPFPIKDTWKWVRFGEIASIASNMVSPNEYPDLPHIAPDSIEKGTGKLLRYRTISEDGVFSPKHYFYPGHILYSKIRPKLSKAVLIDFEGLCSADMYPIKSHIDTEYLFYYMLSNPFLEQATKKDNRVKMPKINQEDLNDILVPIPPLKEQRLIVEKIEFFNTKLFELREYTRTSIEDSEKIMKVILNDVFNRGA